MDQIEKEARGRHGNLMYCITWKARKTNQKWLWWVVVFIATIQFLWREVLIFSISGGIVGLFTGQALWGFAASALLGVILSPFLMPIAFREETIGVMSSYYSAAADMARLPKSATRKVLYLISGAAAVLLALLTVFLNKKSLCKESHFGITELDVLGSVLSKAGRWGTVRTIFKEIERRYKNGSGHPDVRQQLAVSYGLACKWMMGDPAQAGNKEELRWEILNVMNSYPDLPEEITMRYREALQ